ncbi:MAG: hypothetical protein KJN84_13035, partial [Bacteroidia bacterium]|nr:hypothetical protein [Bacteroidia bacterium]
MKQLLQPFFYIFFISSALLSQSTMEVNDPQLWWNESPGHVENVDIQIKPIGLYSEVQLAFDVMASTPERYN